MIRYLTLAALGIASPALAQEMDHSMHMNHMMHQDAGAQSPADTASSADTTVKTGTDQAPGNALPPAVQKGRPADRFYDPAAMARAEAAVLGEHGGMAFHNILIDQAEVHVRNGRNGYSWKADAWFGGDIDRIAIKSEGEGTFGQRIEHAEAQLLWSHALDPYWNLETGIRQDFRHPRTYARIGVEGLAPYWIETEAALFLSDEGKLFGSIEAHHDIRLTQKLLAQPHIELNLAAQDSARDLTAAGLTDIGLGLRVRYEITPEFAPYVGWSWERKLGGTANRFRAAGEDVSAASLRIGIRTSF